MCAYTCVYLAPHSLSIHVIYMIYTNESNIGLCLGYFLMSGEKLTSWCLVTLLNECIQNRFDLLESNIFLNVFNFRYLQSKTGESSSEYK